MVSNPNLAARDIIKIMNVLGQANSVILWCTLNLQFIGALSSYILNI